MQLPSIFRQGRILSLSAAFTFAAGLSSPGHAALLDIPEIPLFVGLETVPNIFLEMDDSGSMDFEVLAPEHFLSCSYDNSFGSCNGQRPSEPGSTNWFRPDSDDSASRDNQWVYFSRAADNRFAGDDGGSCPGQGDGSSSGDRVSVKRCAELNFDIFDRVDWRFGSSDFNLMYFNPEIIYAPWLGFDNASFNAALSNPQSGTDGFTEVEDLASEGGFSFFVWEDNKGYSGGFPSSSPDAINLTDGSNGRIDLWDSYIRVTVTNGGFTCVRSDYSAVADGDDLKLERDDTTISGAACDAAAGNQSFTELQQNIANWYQYARRRILVTKSSLLATLNSAPNFRYGTNFINRSAAQVDMPAFGDTDFAAHNQLLIDTYLNDYDPSGGTPLRRGLQDVGEYFSDSSNGPIELSCQKNFALVFTDGFWNGGNSSTNSIGDFDGDNANGGTQTLADVARYYYETDLRPDLDPNVPIDAFDENPDQHLVTYTIAFGLQGALVDTDGEGFPNPELTESSPEWWTAGNGENQRRIDDLWHAAYNSRGRFISARRPELLTAALQEAILNIQQRIGSAASGSSNGGSISTESRVYQALFNSTDWHGDFLAFQIANDGGLNNTPIWNSGELLNLQPESYFASARQVFTLNSDSETGIVFAWDSLSDTQQAFLNINPQTGLDDGLGAERLLFIRGVDDPDQPFRERENKLGDLVNSDPQFVGAPRFFYPFDDYQSFFLGNLNRTPVLYIGGNDGMLHAFNADTGVELFNYVPNAVIENLNELTDPAYNHEFYVDGSPIYGDVQISGAWRSILAGGLRGGGQAVYALDITNPNAFDASDVLWEFTDEDDNDLGLTFAQPQIARMNNGKWAVIFGNGYNSTAADGNASPDGDAALYILFVEDGIGGFTAGDFVKIETGVGTLADPNGMGPVGLADVNGDSKVDYLYAGDLRGNVWKFDVTSSNSSAWDVAFTGQPLFTAVGPGGEVQPILSNPIAIAHPLGISQGALVVVGTGKYVESIDSDPTVGGTQSMYAVWDRAASLDISDAAGGNGFTRGQFAQIQLGTVGAFRVVNEATSDVPDWLDGDGNPQDRGWFVDLPQQGERVIRRVLVRSGIVFFVTLIPSSEPCVSGGTGFLMALDANTGGVPNPDQQDNPVPFDINGDGEFDDGDYIGSDQVPIGLLQDGIPNLPAVIFDPRPLCERNPEACEEDTDGDGVPDPFVPVPSFPPPLNSFRGCGSDGQRIYLYTTTSNGQISEATASLSSINCGRQGWRQLR